MDKKFLEERLAEGMSLPEIGRVVGRPPGTVGYWVKRHALLANGSEKFRQKGPLDREGLTSLVDGGLSLREIGEELGVPISRVSYWVRRYALGRTGRGRRAAAIKAAREAGIKEVVLECPKHGATPYWIGRTSTRCRKCNSAGVASRRRRVKQTLIEEAGGHCKICGFDGSPVALEFHHTDPGSKSFGVSQAGISRSIARSRAEAAKCVLLCANCHAQVEAGTLQLDVA